MLPYRKALLIVLRPLKKFRKLVGVEASSHEVSRLTCFPYTSGGHLGFWEANPNPAICALPALVWDSVPDTSSFLVLSCFWQSGCFGEWCSEANGLVFFPHLYLLGARAPSCPVPKWAYNMLDLGGQWANINAAVKVNLQKKAIHCV